MLERQLCTEICMSRDDAQLARYQAAFARDWTALWRRVFRWIAHARYAYAGFNGCLLCQSVACSYACAIAKKANR